jgi:hypothetical protein
MAGLLRLTNTKRDNRGIEADVEEKGVQSKLMPWEFWTRSFPFGAATK